VLRADCAFGIGVHGLVARVPEGPDVLGGCDGWWSLEIGVDFGVGAEVEVLFGMKCIPCGSG
jgi:hypothetical protein